MPGKLKNKWRVHFNPDNIDIIVGDGTNLLEAAIAAGIRLSASCGGAGVCGTCKVLIEKGKVETDRTSILSDEEFKQGIRQACQSRIISDLEVYVPVESRLEKAVVARERKNREGASATGWNFAPPLNKYYLELPAATLGDNVNDLSRVLRGLKQTYDLSNLQVDFEVIKKLPEVLRADNWKVTVTTLVTAARHSGGLRRPRLVNIEAGDTREKHYSLAIDVGTTTICGQLLDLNRGAVIAETIEFNRQISYGADVITRIAYCQKPGGLKTLQEAAVATINNVIKELIVQSRINAEQIGLMVVAGNTTMTHILFGLDSKYIRLSPYVPVANFIPPVKACSLGINLAENVYILAFPSVASYIGGDIVSGIITSGVHQKKNLTFYMDVGTNGQIVVGNSEWMVTASCSAGPAFEGGGIKHGMVATRGAIQDFDINCQTLEPTVRTIGGEKPKGICGSGLINIIAGLLEAKVINQKGKFEINIPTDRVRTGNDGYEYVVCRADETQTGQDIVITEVDIDNLIRAKSAMYAGCHTLTKSVQISCNDFERVIIAGNFGSSLNVEKAITIGLLPDIPRDRFIFIGNGSLSGTRLVSFSIDLLDDARRVAGMMTNVELSENNDFTENYIAGLFLPHTDASAFPSVQEKLASCKLN